MRNRLASKLFGKKERIVVLAADHRYFGVVSGLENPYATLSPLLEHADAFMTDPGVLRNFFPGDKLKKVPLILRASGCSTVLDIPAPGYLQETAKRAYEQRTQKKFDEEHEEYRTRVEQGHELTSEEWKEFALLNSIAYVPDTIANERLILGAGDVQQEGGTAAAVSVYLGTPYQTQTLDNLATMSRQARKIGLPVLGVVAVGKALGYLEKDADFLTRAGAVLVAHGADVIKTYNCGKNFGRVVEACGVPVIVAGGKIPGGKDPARDSLELAYDSIQKGAAGIDFGRRVWRHDSPVPMIRSLNEVVHRNATVDAAYEKFTEWVKKE